MSRKVRKIEVATLEQLQSTPYRRRLKMAVENTGNGQREWPTAIQDALLHADRRNIGLYYTSGQRFIIPLVDDVWNDNERYMREFMASEECVYPERDRLIDLYFRIMMPDVARHFER